MLTGRELSQVDQTQPVVACFDYDREPSRMAVEVAGFAALALVSGDHWRKREEQEERVGLQEEEAPSLQVLQVEAAVPRAERVDRKSAFATVMRPSSRLTGCSNVIGPGSP